MTKAKIDARETVLRQALPDLQAAADKHGIKLELRKNAFEGGVVFTPHLWAPTH